MLTGGSLADGKRANPFPYRLQAEVGYGRVAASESVRRELERELIRELDDAGCFAAVELMGDDDEPLGELLLRLIVDDVERRTDYDLSIAERSARDAPTDAANRLEERIEARIHLALLTLPELATVRQKQFAVVGRHRPSQGEDARAVVVSEMIDETAKTTRLWVCKGSARKLSRQIESAREASLSSPTPR
jgi:hypothetical protein